MDTRYNLVITEKQAILIKDALEEYFRIRINQWRDLADSLASKNIDISKENPQRDKVFDRYINERNIIHSILKCVGSILKYDYNNPKTEEQLIAEDIWQVIRHQLWKDNEHRGDWCVDSREPLRMSDEPLPEMKKVEG